MTRACRGCGTLFESDREHHRYCWTCYWQRRDAGHYNGAGWRQPPPEWDDGPGTSSSRGRGSRETELALDSRLLRDAIQLTHPDRHPPERAGMANAVTAALLELLNAARQTDR